MVNAIRALALLGGLSISAAAFAEFNFDDLMRFHKERKSLEGYAYAGQYRQQMEGDPQFDYYYGMLAIDSGHASQGVFALERVLALQPSNHAARLELARGYFALEEYERSRQEFRTVIASQPPANVRAKIERYLDAIRLKEGRYRTTSQGYIELGGGYDSNVNSGPADQRATIGIATLEINDNSLEKSDGYGAFSALYRFDVPFSSGKSIFSLASVDYRGHSQQGQFDNATGQLQAGLTILEGQSRYQFDLQGSQYALDGQAFRNTLALNGQWRYRTSQQGQFSTFAQLSKLEYPDQQVRNSGSLTWGVGMTKNLNASLSPVLYLNGYLGRELPDDDQSLEAKVVSERDFFGLKAGAHVSLTSQSSLGGSLTFQRSQYGGQVALLTEGDQNREDDYINFNADWAWMFTRSWSVRGRASYLVNDSNYILGRYDRFYSDLRLRYDIN